MPLLIGGGVLAGVLLIGVVAAAMMWRGPAPSATIPGTQATFSPPTPAGMPPNAASTMNPLAAAPAQPAPVAPAAPKSNADYEKNLARQTLERAHQGIVNRFTAPKTAIVIINGVEGIEADADHYLERKLFKAAYSEYEAGQKNAQQQTDSNRKQAEAQAVADDQSSAGMRFGPQTVWYRYKQVQSDVPYPDVKGGASGKNQFVYYVGPATDLNQLATRIGVGSVASVDNGSRTLTINAALPVPIPDIDVEEMIIQHGREAVVTLDVTNATGEPDRVMYFLESEAAKLGGEDTPLTVVGPKLIEAGKLRLTVGPVKDVNDFAARISFGSIADLNPQTMSVTVEAKLPAELPTRPTPQEMAEKERKRREGDLHPKDGETEIDWAIRVLKKDDRDVYALERVVKHLAQRDVDADHHDDVAEALVSGIQNRWTWHRMDDYLRAMDVWYEKRIAKALGGMLLEQNPPLHKNKILEVMGNHPSEESAKAAASMLGDFFVGKEASQTLREMGVFAEEAVMKYMTHNDAKVRVDIYDILAEQGTKKGLAKMKGNMTKERDKQMKEILKEAIDRMQTRLKEEGTEPADKPEKT